MYKYLFVLILFMLSCDGKSQGNTDQPDGDKVEETDSTTQPIDTTTINPVDPVDTTANTAADPEYYFYVGTYTDGGSKGIYKSIFDTGSGTISVPEMVAAINNPSFQCISNNNRLLFSVSESWSEAGSVTGYLIDTVTGNLTKTETFSSLGNSPCFVDFDDKTLHVVTSNYSSGNVTMIPVTADGKANGKAYSHQHVGKGPNTSRQEGPHAHCIKIDPLGKFIYSCDLGTDKIYVYTISDDTLKLHKTLETAPGSGPRHLDFHPQQKSMAVIHELDGTLTTYLPDSEGCFSIENNTVSTLPDGYSGQKSCADIHYSNDGRFLYGSNRVHNSIALFRIDALTQIADVINWQSENLRTPRNFAVDPSGKFIIAANQDNNTIVVYKIDQLTGNLTYTGISQTISKPVCITFLKASRK